jgi:hypothetical protein
MNTPLSLNFLNRNPRMADEPADFTLNEKLIPQNQTAILPAKPRQSSLAG